MAKVFEAEKKIEAKYTKAVTSIGGLALKQHEIGIPDRLFIFPNGNSCWVEFKKPSKRSASDSLSDYQRYLMDKLKGFYQKVELISDGSKQAIKEFIERYA